MIGPDYWIQKLGLLPHPEGGFFTECYRSNECIAADALPERFEADRSVTTSIYFLLCSGDFSAMHRIKSDEIWHYYAGTSEVRVHCIYKTGKYHLLRVGNQTGTEAMPQAVVPASSWFGAEIDKTEDAWALVGCTVAPGFDFDDFEMAERNELIEAFPIHEAIIKSLTRI